MSRANKTRHLSIVAFLGCVIGANVLTSRFGLVPIGAGMMVAAGTFTAGLALLARDAVQDYAGSWYVLACIVAGAGASWALTMPRLALASGVAFAVSELADMAVYTPLRRRGWARAAAASGVVGSVVDTVLFLSLAGFPVWAGLPGQVIVKVGVTVLAVLMVVSARAVLRNRVRAEGPRSDDGRTSRDDRYAGSR